MRRKLWNKPEYIYTAMISVKENRKSQHRCEKIV